MDSLPECTSLSASSILTEKQRDLLQLCDIAKYGLELKINEPFRETKTLIALDVEHDESGVFVGCGILVVGSNVVYYYSNICLLSLLPFSTFSVIAHNGKTDLELLRSWGINISDNQLYWDTQLIGHIIDSSLKSYGLKSMVKRDLGIEYPSYDDIVGKKTAKQNRLTLDKQPVELVSAYNALDCYATTKLYEEQHKGYTNCNLYEQVEKPVGFILQQMENRGIRVDLPYLESLKTSLEAQRRPLAEAIANELGPINLNSPKQLLVALQAKGFDPRNSKKASTDKEAISKLPDCALKTNLQKFNEVETLLSVFVYAYLERNQDVVHPYFNQCGTRTGRLSCSNPNLLQIPRRTDNGKLVRRMFIPRGGMVMGDCDFGQIEPRVLAHLSKDPAMCAMFNAGTDFHTFTSERLGISRDRAKVLNLSVGYRATRFSVQRQLGGTLEEAQEQINAWWSLFPHLRRWQEGLIFESKRSGFCTTLLGRRIRVDGLTEGNSWKREAAERQLINNIAQGSAAEIMKMAMIKITNHSGLYPSFGMLVQVYDELLFESPSDWIAQDMQFVLYCMENALKLDVPLTVDSRFGPNWAECH